MAKYLRYFKYLLYALAGIAVAYCLFHVAFAIYYYPQLKPVLNWNRAAELATRLSQITSDDFKNVGLPIPTTKVEIPQADALKLVERLYATKRFPDWIKSPNLEDWDGRLYTVWVRPTKGPDWHRSNSTGLSSPNEFTFGVQVPDSEEIIER